VELYEIDTQMFMPSSCRVLRKSDLLSEKSDCQDPDAIVHFDAH
jgi:hypothetical protein